MFFVTKNAFFDNFYSYLLGNKNRAEHIVFIYNLLNK